MATAQSQRQLILAAMIRVVGQTGYRATSVADVAAEAKASEADFYRHFEDKRECFLEAYDTAVAQVIREVVARCDGRQPWLDRMQTGLATLVDMLTRDPVLARVTIVEVVAAGSDARQRHWNTIERFSEFLEGGRDLAEDRDLPDNVGRMAAGAVSGLIFDEVLAKRGDRLPEILPDLVFALLVPYVGPSAAASAMRNTSTPD